jgi:hypothetical protein
MGKGEKPVPMKSKRSKTISGSPRGITIIEIKMGKGEKLVPMTKRSKSISVSPRGITRKQSNRAAFLIFSYFRIL